MTRRGAGTRRSQAHPREPFRGARSAVPLAVVGAVAVAAVLGLILGSIGPTEPTSVVALGSSPSPNDPSIPVASSVVPAATGSPAGGGVEEPSASPMPTAGPFPGGVLVADRANHRLLVIGESGRILWTFPAARSLPAGWSSVAADDAFLAPDGRSIVANDETHETIVRIDLATRHVIWSYGRYGLAGAGRGMLHTPDDAYPLPNGDIVVADIENCRILEIAPDHRIVHQWGRTGVCVDHPPATFARPNGDTPLPDGGLLITEISGSRVVRLAPDGSVVFDIHVPVAYPSDAQLDANGDVVVADYSRVGQVVAVDPATGRVRWRWRFTAGSRRLDHPSLATPLANGLVSVNDDFRQRLIVIDPAAERIVWQFGRTDVAGHGPDHLWVPDGHQPLPATGPF